MPHNYNIKRQILKKLNLMPRQHTNWGAEWSALSWTSPGPSLKKQQWKSYLLLQNTHKHVSTAPAPTLVDHEEITSDLLTAIYAWNFAIVNHERQRTIHKLSIMELIKHFLKFSNWVSWQEILFTHWSLACQETKEPITMTHFTLLY